MKQTVEVKTEQIVTICDKCGKSETNRPVICQGCRCDLCQQCTQRWTEDIFTGEPNGDYTQHVCLDCTKLAENHRAACDWLRAKYDVELGAHIDTWKLECKRC